MWLRQIEVQTPDIRYWKNSDSRKGRKRQIGVADEWLAACMDRIAVEDLEVRLQLLRQVDWGCRVARWRCRGRPKDSSRLNIESADAEKVHY